MITNRKMAIEPSKDEDSAKMMIERFYLQNCFENYLISIKQSYRIYHHSIPDYKYQIMSQFLDFIDEVFTLPQLYCIFTASRFEFTIWGYNESELNDLKTGIIKCINEYAKCNNDLGDINNLKKNVSELSPIVFTLLNDLFHESDIFCGDGVDGYKYPKISEDETECSTEFKELIQTYAALENIESICKKFYFIEDRVAALTTEGYEIQPCWVGSGGVKSTFYMYNKKEIRIQIAASKFKGNGSSKSKSALCVVIPYPAFLHNNSIKR